MALFLFVVNSFFHDQKQLATCVASDATIRKALRSIDLWKQKGLESEGGTTPAEALV